MKKFAFMVIAITLCTGLAMADRGIDPVPETQGIVTSTSIDAVGNFASSTGMQWRTTNSAAGLSKVPPLGESSAIYESVYTEDTISNGVGLIAYDKELDIETSGQISGQWNVEAAKQLSFVGVNGARVVSSDVIFVDGAANPVTTSSEVICPFASDVSSIFPAYCNRAEAGSTIDMTIANVRTTTTDRFVTPSGDHTVELNHDIRVSELVSNLPSQGMVNAYMDVLIQEGGAETLNSTLAQRMEFHESTTTDGDITLFEKLMHYESGMVR
ncbi:MAG TPA: hypothetical protein VMW63_04055 [Methanoregulaceae archaeon]|nr:hypothetical protein [Methanoregulaceae archaeon]